MVAFVSFWLVIFFLGLAVLPITQRLFLNLWGRGYVFTKTFGLLLISYFLWILATLRVRENSQTTILLIIFFLATLGWFVWGKETTDFLKKRLKYLLVVEILFFLVLAVFALLRAANPELSGGEKPMDLAFINSILRSKYFPPQDPWFAHFPISYYYFGHLMMATLAKFSGLKMAIAFNLEVALIFALVSIGVFGLVFELILPAEKEARGNLPRRPLFFALLTTLTLVMAGNFEVWAEFLNSWGWGSPQFWQSLDIPNLPNFPNNPQFLPQQTGWWWHASRIMPRAITEFPYFSLLFGDLHAHVLAFPLTITAVGLALSEFRRGPSTVPQTRRKWVGFFLHLLLVALLLGSLGFANTWDLPIYLSLWLGVFLLGQLLHHKKVSFLLAKKVFLTLIPVVGLSFILYLPYYLSSYRSNIGLELTLEGSRVSVHHFLLQFGLFLFFLFSFLLILLKTHLGHAKRIFLLTLVLVLIPLLRSKFWLFSLEAFLALSAGFLLLQILKNRAQKDRSQRESILFILALVLLSSLLAFLSETLYAAGVRDNTIFKFYYAIWLLLAVAAGFGAYHLWVSLPKVRPLLMVISLLLLLSAFTYPILATRQKIKDVHVSPTPTLDGLAFLAKENPLEYEAIEWLRTTISGSPVILEVPGQNWSAGSRVSAYTGLPTLVGWIQDQELWRGMPSEKGINFPELYQRLTDIDLIYGAAEEKTTLSLLAKYQVRYIYVGGLERQKYSETVQKFSRYLKPVFQNERVVIYENRRL